MLVKIVKGRVLVDGVYRTVGECATVPDDRGTRLIANGFAVQAHREPPSPVPDPPVPAKPMQPPAVATAVDLSAIIDPNLIPLDDPAPSPKPVRKARTKAQR